MATKTAGTNATTSLTALVFVPGIGGMNAADQATINNAIKSLNRNLAAVGASFDSTGLLTLPDGRGQIQMKPGDYVCVDNRGWPFVIPADSMNNGLWTHT